MTLVGSRSSSPFSQKEFKFSLIERVGWVGILRTIRDPRSLVCIGVRYMNVKGKLAIKIIFYFYSFQEITHPHP